MDRKRNWREWNWNKLERNSCELDEKGSSRSLTLLDLDKKFYEPKGDRFHAMDANGRTDGWIQEQEGLDRIKWWMDILRRLDNKIGQE